MTSEARTQRRAAVVNATTLIASMVVTFVVLRVWLSYSPDSDFDVWGYNIHHLFTGLVLVVLGGVPLAVDDRPGGVRDAARVVFGIGLGLALDEWVYLIATDGTNASYLLPVSFWGGVVVVALAGVYVLAVLGLSSRVR